MEAGAVEPVAEGEEAAQAEEPGAVEQVAEAQEGGAEVPGGDGVMDGPSELR